MANFTLAEAQKLGLDDLQAGIAETIVTNAPLLGMLPFTQIAGNALTFNREATLVDGQYVAADGTITDSSALTNNKVTVSLKSYSGQSDIPNAQLRQQVGVNGGNDLRAIHLASAAKGVSRKFMQDMITGTVATNGFDGLNAILASGAPFAAQVEDAANAAFSLDLVDAAMLRLNGRAGYIMGNAKAEAAFKKAMRAAGGVTTVELNGVFFTSYDGVPFIRNDFCVADSSAGAGTQADIYFGTWGDGTLSSGAQALTTAGDLFAIEEFAALENKSATRVRVILDAGFTVWAPGQIAVLKAVTV